MTTATKFTLADAMKLVGVTQLANATKVDDTYNGIESYSHFGYEDFSYKGATSESRWLIIRLQFAKLRDDNRWVCQVGLAYLREAKGKQFVAIRPEGGRNDKEPFKNINSLDVLVEDLFEMGFVSPENQPLIEEWLVSGIPTLQLAPANSESFIDIVPTARVKPIKALDGTDNADAGAPGKNPIGFSTFHGEGFVPVTAASTHNMGGRKGTGTKVTLGGSAKPNPVVAPAVADAPIAPAIAAAVVAPAAVPTNERAALIRELKEAGFSLSEIMAELAGMVAAPAAVVESDDEYGDMPL